MKFIAGSYALIETVGVTLVEPLLAALPKPLRCLRVGPFASPARYTARDWLITNLLCFWIAFIYFTLNFREISLCGPRDGWVWNTERMIGGVMRAYPSWDDSKPSCDEMGPTVFDTPMASSVHAVVLLLLTPLFLTCLALWMARKLPGWGEPPAAGDDGGRVAPADAPDKDGGKRSTAKKMANAAICAGTTAAAIAGGVSVVGASLDEGVSVVGASLEEGVAEIRQHARVQEDAPMQE